MKDVRVIRVTLFVALAANSVDLLATSLGIHLFGNREGNPLLQDLAHHHWWVFVLVKGAIVPLLIAHLYRLRHRQPVLAPVGLSLVALGLTVAVGQWVGWIAGVLSVGRLAAF